MDHLKIIIENANGQHHMDRDIKLFDLYEKSDLSPTLCLYSWNKPCISLGYSQSIDEEIDPDIANNLGWDVVRRPTGGGIVFHNTSEITYSFFSQIDNPAIPKGLISSYKKISECIISGLSYLGIESRISDVPIKSYATDKNRGLLCFSYPAEYEIVANGKKLVGSAQKRGRRSLLQHGSIFVSPTDKKIFSALKKPCNDHNAISIEELLKRKVGFSELAESLLKGFKLLSLFVMMICIFSSTSNAAISIDPSLKWKTLETLHFKIDYYQGLEDKAYKMASIAEEVHSRLSPLFRHVPDLKTDIVLLDNTDYTNGYTTVFPNPLITIYLSDIGSNLMPMSYDDWLRFVFIHEYTHLLNLDTVEGGAKFLKTLFGREIFPNALSPEFLIEGLAVYIETEKAKGGRGKNPRFEAMLRMDALANNFKSIDQASVDTVKWPMGNVYYLYGVYFLEYLSKTYGEDKLYRLSQEYGDYMLSVGIDGGFSILYGKNLSTLWAEWQDQAIRDAKLTKEQIVKEPLTKPKYLTSRGYYSLKPKWGTDSNSIYYVQSNMDDSTQMRKIDLSNLADNKMLNGSFFDDSLSVTNNYIYCSKGDIFNNFNLYKDIYALDLKTNRLKQLTFGARASDPAVSPDGKKIVFVRNNIGTKTLWISGFDNIDAKMIGEISEGIQYYSPKFFPNGNKVVVAKWLNGDQKLYVIDLQTDDEKQLFTKDMSLEANPTISPDGKYVLFDSDYSGVVNLYAFEMESKKIYKITNVLGMASMPDISPDQKKIVYVDYSTNGYDLALIDFNPSAWTEVHPPEVNHVEYKPTALNSEDIVLGKYDYNPLPSLIPKFWFPYSFYNLDGTSLLAYTAGVDATQQNYYSLQAGFDWKGRLPYYYFYYINNQYLPQITLSLADVDYAYSWDNSTKTYWERENDQALYFSFIDNRMFSEYDRQSLTFGIEQTSLSNLSSLEVLYIKPTLGNLVGANISYGYNNTRSYGYSIAPEEGLTFGLSLRSYSKALGSQYNLNNYAVSSKQYFKMPAAHHVLSLQETGTLNRGDSFVQSGFNYNYLSLRGYPYNTVVGSKTGYFSSQYLFPISYPESGFGYGYLFFDRLWASIYFDQGGATFGKFGDIMWKRTYGAELNLSTISGWGMFPVTFILGYAKGIDVQGEEQMYFNFTI